MAEETKDIQVEEGAQATETTETTETFIEEVEVKRTRKSPVKTSSSQASPSGGAAPTAAKKGEPYKVIVPLLNIREKASLVAEILGTLQEGDIIEISTKTPKGFGKIADDEGYVKLDYVEKIVDAQQPAQT